MKNEEKIKLQNERIERIKALINNSIKIRCDATLENNQISKNYDNFINKKTFEKNDLIFDNYD